MLAPLPKGGCCAKRLRETESLEGRPRASRVLVLYKESQLDRHPLTSYDDRDKEGSLWKCVAYGYMKER
jgi:hypothetical protein